MSIAHNTIILKNYLNIFEEFTAGGEIYPGMLIELTGVNTVEAHDDDAPAACLPMFAIEDALQGKTINEAYVSGEKVKCWTPTRGDVVWSILEDGANVTAGDFLESNGSGYLQKYTSGTPVGIALETMDLSGSSGEESSESPFGFNKRIKVKIH